ncbi:DUF899 family protein [Dactylosporangium sp. CA-139066]|uniref:DUF899 family protein n=1 Tax=Dactylosporangium sp. CA-139066 TaxID=3239930 RepID=UPI003D8B4625
MTDALWPAGAGEEYRKARSALLDAERALRDRVEEVAAARRALPPGAVLPAYTFEEGPADLGLDEPVTTPALADLFGGHDTLVVYHLMYAPQDDGACPMCSMWVDGFQGVHHHLARHTGFAVVAKAPLPKLREWGRRRGWDGLRLLSSHRSDFNRDLHAEDDEGQRPGLSVFRRQDGTVRHWYTMHADFSPEERERGIDSYSPVWSVLDLLPQGRGDWYAGNDYAGRSRASL